MDEVDYGVIVETVKEVVSEAGDEGIAKEILFEQVEQKLDVVILPKRRGPLVKAAGLLKQERQGDVFYTLPASTDPESEEENNKEATLAPDDEEQAQTTEMWIEATGTLKFESDDGSLKVKARVRSFSFERQVGKGGE